MFERFTEQARRVVVLAQHEARALRHYYIGTEHILLGLLAQDEGLGARVLASLGLSLEAVRARVVEIVAPSDKVTSDQIPFIASAKKVLELALREALALGHNYIGTEHILLGLVRDHESVAVRILVDSDADPEAVRHAVLVVLIGHGLRGSRATGTAAVSESTFTVGPDRELKRLLRAAAGRALTGEREEFGPADLLAVAREHRQDVPDATETDDLQGSE